MNQEFFTTRYYLANAFSLQMLDTTVQSVVSIEPVSTEEVSNLAASNKLLPCIGHKDTALVLSKLLNTYICVNRMSIRLFPGDILYVAQIIGGRLPEGAVELPEGFRIKFFKVRILFEEESKC